MRLTRQKNTELNIDDKGMVNKDDILLDFYKVALKATDRCVGLSLLFLFVAAVFGSSTSVSWPSYFTIRRCISKLIEYRCSDSDRTSRRQWLALSIPSESCSYNFCSLVSPDS